MFPGKLNVINAPVVSRDRIILPPLDIKLELKKTVCKGLKQRWATFEVLSTENIKACIFYGFEIKTIYK